MEIAFETGFWLVERSTYTRYSHCLIMNWTAQIECIDWCDHDVIRTNTHYSICNFKTDFAYFVVQFVFENGLRTEVNYFVTDQGEWYAAHIP